MGGRSLKEHKRQSDCLKVMQFYLVKTPLGGESFQFSFHSNAIALLILQNRGNRHTLTIRNVTYNDFGNYTCQASNNLGKDRASLTLSGIPSVCTFDSVRILKLLHSLLTECVLRDKKITHSTQENKVFFQSV